MKNRMKDENIIISVNGSVSMEEGKAELVKSLKITLKELQ